MKVSLGGPWRESGLAHVGLTRLCERSQSNQSAPSSMSVRRDSRRDPINKYTAHPAIQSRQWYLDASRLTAQLVMARHRQCTQSPSTVYPDTQPY
jgi:hypothetical protein